MKKDSENMPAQKVCDQDKTPRQCDIVDREDPVWFDGKTIDEVVFCDYMLGKRMMKCIHGILYDLNGRVDIEKLENEIFIEVKPYFSSNVAKIVFRLKDAIKIAAYSQEMPIEEDRIHFSNGTYHLADKSFTAEKTFCMNRLPARFDLQAIRPVHWQTFLDELLYPEDIPSLQEFMGYTLIPTNKSQVMMIIIGNGGEGKSRIALVLRALHGENMNMCSIQKLASDRFARADQEGKLLMVDDDMKMDALPDTGILKTIVTLEDKFDLERKGKQSVQGYLYVRLLVLGNGALSALYDKSDGFYRRQLVLKVKNKPEKRVDDRNLINKMIAESEGILQWCLVGLHRLIDQGFEFSVSDRMKNNLEEMKKNDNNIFDFYESSGYISFEKGTHASSRQLYVTYRKWCEDNLEKPLAERTFASQLKRDEKRLGIHYDKNLNVGGGKKARGYHGVNVQVNIDGYGS